MIETKRLDEMFSLAAARSKGVDDYQPGPVPFVTSTELNNGVVRYVEPLVGDAVFKGPALCISGLGHATVQVGRFLPKGNGGDSMTIGMPNTEWCVADLVAAAAAFNVLHRWRFSYGRKCSRSRLGWLRIPTTLPEFEKVWRDEADRAESVNAKVLQLPVLTAKAERYYQQEIGDPALPGRELIDDVIAISVLRVPTD
jgi:hypothetical protein